MSNEEIAKLTEKQRRFCEEYIFDWNGKRAAINSGYSEDTAAVIACENLKKPNILQYISFLERNIPAIARLANISYLKNAKEVSNIAYDEFGKPLEKMKAVEILNKMFGFDSGEKLDITSLGDKVGNSPTIVFKKITNE